MNVRNLSHSKMAGDLLTDGLIPPARIFRVKIFQSITVRLYYVYCCKDFIVNNLALPKKLLSIFYAMRNLITPYLSCLVAFFMFGYDTKNNFLKNYLQVLLKLVGYQLPQKI